MTRVPQAAAACVRAGAVVSSPSEALAELVANSLDAGATEVNVEVDLPNWALRVHDNGAGIRESNLGLLGRNLASSRRAAVAGPSSAAPVVLGYRGEALLAICAVAQEVEVISRAAGTFETYRLLLRAGQAVEQGLAMEQRSKQGTLVSVRGLFFNQPVRCKALTAAGLRFEVERCRHMVLQLALLRPHVTFTCFDRGCKAFLLRLLKGRMEQQTVAEGFLGHPLEHVAVVQPVAGAAYAISGYAVLPPHGHTNASRQLLLLNGRSIKAPLISMLVEGLFQQLYKPNMRLQDAQRDELQQMHKASNRHAAFVLQVSCDASKYELSREAGSNEVQFCSWALVLGAVRHALLAAWQLVLSNALLKQLEELEGSVSGSPGALDAGVAPAAAQVDGSNYDVMPAAPRLQIEESFQRWLQEQQAEPHVLGLPQLASNEADQRSTALPDPAEAVEVAAADASSRQRGSGRQWQLSGAKHNLASRLVRLGGAGFGPGAARYNGQGVDVPPQHKDGYSGMPLRPRERALQRVCPEARPPKEDVLQTKQQQPQQHSDQEQHQCQPPWASLSSKASCSWVLAGDPPMPALVEGPPAPAVRADWQVTANNCLLDPAEERQVAMVVPQAPHVLDELPSAVAAMPHRLPVSSEDEIAALMNRWAQHHWRQPETGEQRVPFKEVGNVHSIPRSSSNEEIEARIMSWGRQRGRTTTLQGRPSAVGMPYLLPRLGKIHGTAGMPRGLENPCNGQAVVTAAEAALLDGIATSASLQSRAQQAQSAPPRYRGRKQAALQQSCSRQSGSNPRLAAVPQLATHRQADKQGSAEAAGNPGQQRHFVHKASVPEEGPDLPDFLASTALECLFASWRQPSMRSAMHRGGSSAQATTSGSEGILPIEAVALDAFTQLKPPVLTRQDLTAGTALQQIDCKYIPVVCGSLLALVDQHAADERVQLELLRDQLLARDGQREEAQCHALRAPVPLCLTDAEKQLLEAHQHKVTAWGWRWQWQPGGGTGYRGSPGALLTHTPLLWGTMLTGTDLKQYLHHLQDTCGAGSLPAGVVRVLNSKACRSAIMFGDKLTKQQCHELLNNLKQTQLCFSCAHGRPTTVPLVDLRLLRKALQLRQHIPLVDGGGCNPLGQQASKVQLAGLKSKLQQHLSNFR